MEPEIGNRVAELCSIRFVMLRGVQTHELSPYSNKIYVNFTWLILKDVGECFWYPQSNAYLYCQAVTYLKQCFITNTYIKLSNVRVSWHWAWIWHTWKTRWKRYIQRTSSYSSSSPPPPVELPLSLGTYKLMSCRGGIYSGLIQEHRDLAVLPQSVVIRVMGPPPKTTLDRTKRQKRSLLSD